MTNFFVIKPKILEQASCPYNN